jgi:ketosteroid isomerase-like protein
MKNSISEPSRRHERLPVIASVLLLAVALQGCASTASPRESNDAGLVVALTRQADDWDNAIVRKDLPAIAANMTQDFRQIRSNGTAVNREVFLRDITAPDFVMDPYSVEDFDVRIYGDVALLSGRTRMTGSYAGRPFATHYRYIDVYVRRDGQWKVCSVQTTTILEPLSLAVSE